MKVKALIDCVGLGYNLKKDDEVELKESLATKLINFGYVEGLEGDSDDENPNNENPDTTNNENTTLTIDDLPNKSGWYELPNGEKIQGREKAEEALKELQKEGEE